MRYFDLQEGFKANEVLSVCAFPLILSLYLAHRKAKRYADLGKYTSPYKMLGTGRLLVSLFWQLDVVGIILSIAMFALILVPFTIAGGVSSSWHEAHIIAPLVIGLCCIPAFVLWEKRAHHPKVPFHVGFSASFRVLVLTLGLASQRPRRLGSSRHRCDDQLQLVSTRRLSVYRPYRGSV